MAQKVVKTSQVIEITCDGCGFSEQYDVASADPSVESNLTKWFIIKKTTLHPSGQTVEGRAHAHSLECIPAAALKIAFVPEEADQIDLESLRANAAKPDAVN